MSPYGIRLTTAGLHGLTPAIEQDLLPRISFALQAIAAKTTDVWREKVRRAPGIWWVERNRYIGSLQWRMTGAYAVEIGTDETIAELIEKGRPARDLKTMLNTSRKVRRTEKGRRFLVIPFRHNTPGHDALAPAMSPQAYKLALGLSASLIIGHSRRPSGQVVSLNPRTGMRASPMHTPFASDVRARSERTVRQRHYQWGGRLTAQALQEAGFSSSDIKRYAGMVRMNVNSPGGRARSSAYLTFRIMAEGQSGWIVPAKPGLWLARDVANAIQPVAQTILEKAAMLEAG